MRFFLGSRVSSVLEYPKRFTGQALLMYYSYISVLRAVLSCSYCHGWHVCRLCRSKSLSRKNHYFSRHPYVLSNNRLLVFAAAFAPGRSGNLSSTGLPLAGGQGVQCQGMYLLHFLLQSAIHQSMAFDQQQITEIVADDSDLEMRFRPWGYIVQVTFVGNYQMFDSEGIV
jgi:hypothetical protein